MKEFFFKLWNYPMSAWWVDDATDYYLRSKRDKKISLEKQKDEYKSFK